MKVKSISVPGQSHPITEDFLLFQFGNGKLKAALGDWASNLVGGPYAYPEVACSLGERPDTRLGGGVIGSILARETMRESGLSGFDLIDKINQRIRQVYKDLGVKDYEKNRELTFTGYITHFTVDSKKMQITSVGDIQLACDGKIIAGKRKKIDIYNAQKRKGYIEKTGDYEGGFNYIRPSIIRQYQYQNTPGNEFSYPAIDGTETLPKEEIAVLSLPTPKKILVWTDGYLPPDEDFSITGLEKKLKDVYAEDPHRCTKYPAVGYLKDDRTALEITLEDGFDKVEISN